MQGRDLNQSGSIIPHSGQYCHPIARHAVLLANFLADEEMFAASGKRFYQVVGRIRRRPREVSLITISLLDFPPSRYRLERRTRTPDRTLLSL